MDVLSLVTVECCHVEVSASSCSLVQKSTTKRDVSECDREASIMRRPWPSRGSCAMEIWITLHQKFDFKQCRREASPMLIIWMAVVYFGKPNTTTAVTQERAASHHSTNVYNLRWRISVCRNWFFFSILFLSTINSQTKRTVHPRTGYEGPEGKQRYNLTSALDGGGLSMPRPGRFTPGNEPAPNV